MAETAVKEEVARSNGTGEQIEVENPATGGIAGTVPAMPPVAGFSTSICSAAPLLRAVSSLSLIHI